MTSKVRRGVMRWIVATSLRFRFIVVAIAVLMMAFGSLQLAKMPVDVFPEFAPPRVEIQTMCNGLSTGDVESLVTVPLEQVLNGIEGLDWALIALALFVDLGTNGGGIFGRDRRPKWRDS